MERIVIARHAKLRELVRRRHADGSVSYHASVLADGVETTFLITAAEHDAAEHALAKGARFVLRFGEEPVT